MLTVIPCELICIFRGIPLWTECRIKLIKALLGTLYPHVVDFPRNYTTVNVKFSIKHFFSNWEQI